MSQLTKKLDVTAGATNGTQLPAIPSLMDALARGLIWNTRSTRLMCYVHLYGHYYSLYAKWLGGFCRRLSGDDRTCRFSNERHDSLLCIILFAEAGCGESVTCYQAKS